MKTNRLDVYKMQVDGSMFGSRSELASPQSTSMQVNATLLGRLGVDTKLVY